MDRPQLLVTAPMLPIVLETLGTRFALHKLFEQEDPAAF
jgi:hypothetical protein